MATKTTTTQSRNPIPLIKVGQRLLDVMPKDIRKLLHLKNGDVLRLEVQNSRTTVMDKSTLRKQLQQGYRRWAPEHRQLAKDWFPLDQQAWDKTVS